MKIKVITTCANKKVLPSVVDLKDCSSMSEWEEKLSTPSESLPAIDLYKGGYWNNVKKLYSQVDDLYIISQP